MVSDFKLALEVIGHVRGSTHGGYGVNGRCSQRYCLGGSYGVGCFGSTHVVTGWRVRGVVYR
jgi:hypothetical protein